MSTIKRYALAVLGLLVGGLSGVHALAGPTQSNVGAPGGYVTACASFNPEDRGSFQVGADLERAFTVSGSLCRSDTFSSTGGGATADVTFNLSTSSGAASGSAAFGAIRLQATELAKGASAAGVGGGWTERMSVTRAGQDGESAVWLFRLHVSGSGFVEQFGGGVSAAVGGFRNGELLSRTVSGWNGGTASTGLGQSFSWGSGSTRNAPATLAIDETLTFAVPVTLGRDFNWGIYATALARGPFNACCGTYAQSVDFGNTFRYAGSAGLVVDGVLYQDETFVSASGIDWRNAAPVPEPGAWVLLLSGLCAVAAVCRARSISR